MLDINREAPKPSLVRGAGLGAGLFRLTRKVALGIGIALAAGLQPAWADDDGKISVSVKSALVGDTSFSSETKPSQVAYTVSMKNVSTDRLTRVRFRAKVDFLNGSAPVFAFALGRECVVTHNTPVGYAAEARMVTNVVCLIGAVPKKTAVAPFTLVFKTPTAPTSPLACKTLYPPRAAEPNMGQCDRVDVKWAASYLEGYDEDRERVPGVTRTGLEPAQPGSVNVVALAGQTVSTGATPSASDDDKVITETTLPGGSSSTDSLSLLSATPTFQAAVLKVDEIDSVTPPVLTSTYTLPAAEWKSTISLKNFDTSRTQFAGCGFETRNTQCLRMIFKQDKSKFTSGYGNIPNLRYTPDGAGAEEIEVKACTPGSSSYHSYPSTPRAGVPCLVKRTIFCQPSSYVSISATVAVGMSSMPLACLPPPTSDDAGDVWDEVAAFENGTFRGSPSQ